MSRLNNDDDDLHYRGTDAHCWIAPVRVDQVEWEQLVREHLVEHIIERGSLDRARHMATHRELA